MARRLLILVSGLAASGKSTLCARLAKRLGLKRYSGGEALKRLALKMGFRPSGRKWWDSEEGLRFLSIRQRDKSFDKAVDEELLSIARSGSAVIDSWVLPWLIDEGFKVWLKASPQIRAKRMSRRSGMSVEEAMRVMEERDKENYRLYYELYGIKLGEDLSPFHLVLDTTNMSPDGVYRAVLAAVRAHFRL